MSDTLVGARHAVPLLYSLFLGAEVGKSSKAPHPLWVPCRVWELQGRPYVLAPGCPAARMLSAVLSLSKVGRTCPEPRRRVEGASGDGARILSTDLRMLP